MATTVLVVHEAFVEAFLGWGAGKYTLVIGNSLLLRVTDSSMYVLMGLFRGRGVFGGAFLGRGAGKYMLVIGNSLLQSVTYSSMYF